MSAVTPRTRAIVRDIEPHLPDVAGLLSRLCRKVLQHYLNRRAAAELARMSDAQLRDIGLTRGDILDAVHGRTGQRRDLS